MIRNWYNQTPHPALKTQRETTKYINWQQFTKGTRGKPNEQPPPRQAAIQPPKIHQTTPPTQQPNQSTNTDSENKQQ